MAKLTPDPKCHIITGNTGHYYARGMVTDEGGGRHEVRCCNDGHLGADQARACWKAGT